jgi:hypothetical protein
MKVSQMDKQVDKQSNTARPQGNSDEIKCRISAEKS